MTKLILLLLALPLSGCAAQMMETASQECAAFGLAVGSGEYASCVERRFAAQQEAFQSAVAQQSAIQQQAADDNNAILQSQMEFNRTSITPPVRPRGFLKGSYVNGLNRICVYDDLGSEYVLTVGSSQLCPR